MSKSERNYSIYKFEFLVLKWLVIEKFLDYLIRVKFVVFMGNNFLMYVFIIVKLDVIGYRWIVSLLFYNFSIMYKLGKMNIDVDLLFRLLGKIDREILDVDVIRVIMVIGEK